MPRRICILLFAFTIAAVTTLPAVAQLLPQVTPKPAKAPATKPAQIVVETSPNAEVYVDDQYTGRASPEGRLVIGNPKPGEHNLRVSFAGKRDFQRKITVVAGKEVKIVATLAELPVVTPTALPQQPKYLLTKGQVMDLVKSGMNSTDLAERIEERGIDFEPTDDYLEALRNAGAQDAAIKVLRDLKAKPLTREQVGELVAGGVPSERAAMLVKQRGIDFEVDEQYLKTLRVAGADDTLIASLRAATAAALAELFVTTSPSAGVSLDGALQGRADWLGKFVVKVTPGTHVVQVSLAGKKSFVQTVTLVTRQTTYVHAGLEDVAQLPVPGTKAEEYPTTKEMRIFRTADEENGTITLRYPSCITINNYGLWRGVIHRLNNQKDMDKGGHARLELNITPGCSPSRLVALSLGVEGQRYPVGQGGEMVYFRNGSAAEAYIDIPMSIWRSASDMKLVLVEYH